MSRATYVCVVVVVGVGLLVFAALAVPAEATSRRAILDAIRYVESGGADNPPDGDGGRAIGPYQIHRRYWQDAVEFEPRLGPGEGYRYEDCRERAYAEQVVRAYMRRWVPEAWENLDAEVIARTHNGGPDGAQKRATARYWRKVRRFLR